MLNITYGPETFPSPLACETCGEGIGISFDEGGGVWDVESGCTCEVLWMDWLTIKRDLERGRIEPVEGRFFGAKENTKPESKD